MHWKKFSVKANTKVLIDNSKHIDIDNKFDFKFAEFLLKKKLI